MNENIKNSVGRRFLRPHLAQYGLVCLMCTLLLTAVIAQTEGTPKIEIPVWTVELGEIDRGEKVTASFEVRNVGSGELRILKVRPG